MTTQHEKEKSTQLHRTVWWLWGESHTWAAKLVSNQLEKKVCFYLIKGVEFILQAHDQFDSLQTDLQLT